MKRAEQKEQRRQEILEAGLDQFIRRGYGATKIKDIADAAHMSVGLLFHYFKSKEELYLELVKLGVSGPEQMMQGVLPASALSFFEFCAQGVLSYAVESLFTAKMFVLMGSAYYREDTPQEAQEIARKLDYYNQMAPLVVQGQQEGTIREGNPVALCMTFWVALQGVIEVYALNPEFPLPQAEWIVDIIRKKD